MRYYFCNYDFIVHNLQIDISYGDFITEKVTLNLAVWLYFSL